MMTMRGKSFVHELLSGTIPPAAKFEPNFFAAARHPEAWRVCAHGGFFLGFFFWNEPIGFAFGQG